MQSGKFNFTFLNKKELQCLTKKTFPEYLTKWGMITNIKVKFYNFNEKFLPYQKQEFVESFFTDPNVVNTMEVFTNEWHPMILATPIAKVEVQQIPCTITSMNFFTRITCQENNVVRMGHIMECMEEYIDGYYVNDNLRALFLNPQCEQYNLYSSSEKQQFIFQLFKHFCLGGEVCQSEFNIKPYLDITKQFYKELISVQRGENQNEINIRSIVLKVVAYDENMKPICPIDPENKQNFIYLIIDDFKRQVAVVMHQYGSFNYLEM